MSETTNGSGAEQAALVPTASAVIVAAEEKSQKEVARRKAWAGSVLAEDRWNDVLALMATGMSANKACTELGVAHSQFNRTIAAPDSADPAEWPGTVAQRRESYAQARQRMIDAMADGLREHARAALGAKDAAQVQAYRLIVDTDKWLLSKVAHTQYGDRLDVQHAGSVTLALAKDDAAL